MHDYLRAIGFSKIKNKKEYYELLNYVLEEPTEVFMSSRSLNSPFGGMSKEFADSMGMMVFGDFNEVADLEAEYCFPYIKGREVSMNEYISVEKQLDKNSYMGVCEDVNLGVSVIFQLLNMKDYVEYKKKHDRILRPVSVTLSALSIDGKIVLPIYKEEKQIERKHWETAKHNQMIAQARMGNQEAIESLTLEDMDLYAMIAKRVKNEDVLSIVESYFMPCGISCDQYAVMGTILDVETLTNSVTGEAIYRMILDCNDLVFDLCINKEDLLGEPEVGRRFRGNIWLQGLVDFNEKGL